MIENFAEQLHFRREAAGLSRGALAREMESSVVNITGWEKGTHSPRLDHAIKILGLLGAHLVVRWSDAPEDEQTKTEIGSAQDFAETLRQVREVAGAWPEGGRSQRGPHARAVESLGEQHLPADLPPRLARARVARGVPGDLPRLPDGRRIGR